ncbi:hypothetical protein K1F50_15805 [Muricauda oceani]|uniref:Uncharacterized protein n=1 Tax=Flagellimonas oceani TaxID=2698672 RepID=A0A6G7J0B9_9FLAO|nr:hypothetical protein [Allomuricauda oceani]MBW8244274.1 hypothetical protein [Allomuricauda oceani]QII44079.1 hypothetical protein GVT53_05130 [Allomuricauda oceani]
MRGITGKEHTQVERRVEAMAKRLEREGHDNTDMLDLGEKLEEIYGEYLEMIERLKRLTESYVDRKGTLVKVYREIRKNGND